MSRPEGCVAAAAPAVLLALAALVVAGGAAPNAAAAPASSAASPPGASALDALGDLREAESLGYNLVEDGVRVLAMRVRSPTIDALSVAGGPLEGRAATLDLWWRDGEARVVVGGAEGVEPEVVESLRELVRPLPALLLPQRPSQGLVGSSFRARNVGSVLRPGDRGIEAIARSADAPIRTALFALSVEGLIVGERLERADGRASEFRHGWSLQGGRYLLTATEGWIPGKRVAAEIEWGGFVGARPVPTRLIVHQADLMAPWPESASSIEFRLSQHRVNVEPPPGLFGR